MMRGSKVERPEDRGLERVVCRYLILETAEMVL